MATQAFLPAPFVVGVGRSGTTLLRLMLDAHPQLAIPPETHFIPVVARACQDSSAPREAFLQALIAHPRWEDQHVDIELLRQRMARLEPFDPGDGLRAFYTLYAARFGKARWGDKTPPYQLEMPLIQSLLPEAHFIHLIRDGRDVALSIQGLWFGPSSIDEAARWWAARIRQTREQATGIAHYRELRYEDLVVHTEPNLRAICDFIHLPWHPAMLSYHGTAESRLQEMARGVVSPQSKKMITAEQRLAIHAFTRQPPQASRVNRWKREMSAADVRRFQRLAGPLLEELGYELT